MTDIRELLQRAVREPARVDTDSIRRGARHRQLRFRIAVSGTVAVVLAASAAAAVLTTRPGGGRTVVATTPTNTQPASTTTPSPRHDGDPCFPDQLVVMFGGFRLEGSSARGSVTFTNVGANRCTLSGEPVVKLTNAVSATLRVEDHPVATTTTSQGSAGTVTLAADPPTKATVALVWTNYCGPPAGRLGVLVTFGSWDTPARALASPAAAADASRIGPCDDPRHVSVLEVSPVTAGGVPSP